MVDSRSIDALLPVFFAVAVVGEACYGCIPLHCRSAIHHGHELFLWMYCLRYQHFQNGITVCRIFETLREDDDVKYSELASFDSKASSELHSFVELMASFRNVLGY